MLSKNTLRGAIFILALATSLIHLSLNFVMGGFDFAFTANSLGYLVFLAAFFLPISFLKGREKLVQMAFMGFAAVTIVAWVFLGDKNITSTQGMLGYTDKLIEILLIAALYQHGPNKP